METVWKFNFPYSFSIQLKEHNFLHITTKSYNNSVRFVTSFDYFFNTDITAWVHVFPTYTDRNLVTEVRVWICSYLHFLSETLQQRLGHVCSVLKEAK